MEKFAIALLFLFAAHQAYPQFNSYGFQKELPMVNLAYEKAPLPKPTEKDLLSLSGTTEELALKAPALLASLPLEDFKLTSRFGIRPDPFTGNPTFHRGIDLKADRSKVFSILPGKVLSTGYDSLLGSFVKVRHGKYEAVYGHLSQVRVSSGDEVLPGSILGISGSTGKATGDHLHLSIKKGNNYVNPSLFLQMISKLTTKEELITYLSKP
jgi:murein DD-endopeptidase MepM/ murein hydrolase activator NlpD